MRDVIDKFTRQYRFLSNFYPCLIWAERDGIKLPGHVYFLTVEHAYQASKTLQPLERLIVARCDTPAKAKQAGRHVTLRADWEEIKVDIMRDLLWEKFSYHDLRKKLLATGDARLVEWNSQGRNLLGQLLQAIRQEIRESHHETISIR